MRILQVHKMTRPKIIGWGNRIQPHAKRGLGTQDISIKLGIAAKSVRDIAKARHGWPLWWLS